MVPLAINVLVQITVCCSNKPRSTHELATTTPEDDNFLVHSIRMIGTMSKDAVW